MSLVVVDCLSLVNSGDKSSLVDGPFSEVVATPPMDEGTGELERPLVVLAEALAAVEEDVEMV